MKEYQIFISYRRDGGEHLAGRLCDQLSNLGYSVFYDVESMRSGEFNVQIYDAIDACSDVLLVLPPNALDRCADENDWVRLEIEHAIKKHKHIIPIIMRNFNFPETLPDALERIRYLDGVIASSEYFDAVVQKIVSRLKCKSPNGFGENDVKIASEEGRIVLKLLSWLRDKIYTWRIIFYIPAAALIYIIWSFLSGVWHSQEYNQLPPIGDLPGIVSSFFIVIAPFLCGIAMKIISNFKKMRKRQRNLTTVITIFLIIFLCSLICSSELVKYSPISIFFILVIPAICSVLAAFFTVITRIIISAFISILIKYR